MKAAVLTEPGKLEIQDVKILAPNHGEALIKICSTAVCGTDVALFMGKYPAKRYPIVQGHESSGIIVSINSAKKGFKEGDRVVMNPAIYCGDCICCLNDLENICLNGGLLGKDVNGTFAEYVVVKENSLIHLPESISFENATSLHTMASA